MRICGTPATHTRQRRGPERRGRAGARRRQPAGLPPARPHEGSHGQVLGHASLEQRTVVPPEHDAGDLPRPVREVTFEVQTSELALRMASSQRWWPSSTTQASTTVNRVSTVVHTVLAPELVTMSHPRGRPSACAGALRSGDGVCHGRPSSRCWRDDFLVGDDLRAPSAATMGSPGRVAVRPSFCTLRALPESPSNLPAEWQIDAGRPR